LISYTKEYLQCILTPERLYCDEILDPKKANRPSVKFQPIGTRERWEHLVRVKSEQQENHE